MIIGFSGYATSGKDTVASMITDIDNSFKIKKFSGKLKQVASILTGIDAHMFESQSVKESPLPGWEVTDYGVTRPMLVRDLLQRLGTEAIRNGLHTDAWVNALFCDYRQGDNWLITDVRFPNEYAAIKKWGGIVVRVNRDGVKPINGHSSETALDSYSFDLTIDNSSNIETLSDNVFVLFNQILWALNKKPRTCGATHIDV